ncbi:MAG: hypothetical protein U5J98_08030 [Halobacteriales archaeon]|nr:hypothetical protein [Halobacteriales archaeon]
MVEVRDRFNNPVSNVTVEANVTKPANGGATSQMYPRLTATTQADGRATFTYTAPDDVSGAQEADINMTFDGDGTVRNETVTFDVRVLDADGSGGSGGAGGQ